MMGFHAQMMFVTTQRLQQRHVHIILLIPYVHLTQYVQIIIVVLLQGAKLIMNHLVRYVGEHQDSVTKLKHVLDLRQVALQILSNLLVLLVMMDCIAMLEKAVLLVEHVVEELQEVAVMDFHVQPILVMNLWLDVTIRQFIQIVMT